MILPRAITTVFPELVEGLFFFRTGTRQGFDSPGSGPGPNGVCWS